MKEKILEVRVADGKYAVIQYVDGSVEVERHKVKWLNATGDRLILALAQEVEKLREENKTLMARNRDEV